MAAVGATIFAVALVTRVRHDGAMLATMLLYGLCTIELYAWSAAYHVVTWTPERRQLMRAIDHANIYVVIAATSTAIGWNVLDGWERTVLLVSVWGLAATGALVSVCRVRPPASWRVVLYLSTGLTGLIALPGLLRALPLPAIGGIVLGGLLYALGGLVYARRHPDPFPRVFGYHELFHLLVIAGGAAFAVVIWDWVVPLSRAGAP